MGTSHTEGEALRRLIEKWRESAEWEITDGSPEFGKSRDQCADELEAALSPLSGPVDASGEPRTDAVDLVRYLTKRQREVRLVIEDYPLGGYQRELDIIETLLELVEGAAAVPSSPAQPQAIRAHVPGCRKSLSVPVDLCSCGGRDFIPDPDFISALPPSSPVADSPTHICVTCNEWLDGVQALEHREWNHNILRVAEIQSAPSPSAGAAKDKE